MQQMREKQPYFKPLNTSEFPKTSFKNELHQTKQKTLLSDNATLKNIQNVQEQETLQEGERLSSLHAKLHQEADKIRKWKVQTEIELRQKDTKLHEANGTVEKLRSSIIEVQLQNESLSLKLQEEMANRSEILTKIDATRDMCNLLKNHITSVDEAFTKCETERTELKYKEREHCKQFENLSEKFQTLNIRSKEEIRHLENKMKQEEEDKEKLRRMFDEKIKEAEVQLKILMQQCEEKDADIEKLGSQVAKFKQNEHDLKIIEDKLRKKIDELNCQLKDKDCLFRKIQEELDKWMEKHYSLECDFNQIKCDLSNETSEKIGLEKSIETLKAQHSEEVKSLRTEIENALALIVHEKQNCTELQGLLDRAESSIEKLQRTKDTLIQEKTDIETRMGRLEEEKKELIISRALYMEREHSLNESITGLETNLDHTQNICTSHEKNIADLKNEMLLLSDNIVNLKKQLEDELSAHYETKKTLDLAHVSNQQGCEVLKDRENEMCQLSNSMDILSKQKAELESTLHKMTTDLTAQEEAVERSKQAYDDLKKHNEELSSEKKDANQKIKKLEKQVNDLNCHISELTAEYEEQVSLNETLTEEKESLNADLQDQLQSNSKETTELESKTKSMKTEISQKNKQMKELEKEIKSLKTKLNNQTKSSEEKSDVISEMEGEVQTLVGEKDSLQSKIEDLEKKLKDEKKKYSDAATKVDKMKNETGEAIADKDKSIAACEQQMSEMTATLEKYKQENQKIVQQKEKRIEELKNSEKKSSCDYKKYEKQMDELKREKSEFETKMNEQSNAKIEDMQQTIDGLTSKNSSLQEKLKSETESMHELMKEKEEFNSEIRKLTNDLQYKEEETRKAMDDLKAKAIKITSNQVTQTTCELSVDKRASSPAASKKTTNIKQTPKVKKNHIERSSNVKNTPKLAMLSSSSPKKADSHSHVRLTPKLAMLSTDSPKVPDTPIHKKSAPRTPLAMMVTPQPQKGILKNTASIKKRKVAFASDGEDSDGESSSSELMEVELGDMKLYPGSKVATPLLLKPSPRVRGMSPSKKSVQDSSKLSLDRKPRGPPVDVNKHREEKKMTNIKKTPVKTPGKFFKTSPLERKKKSKEDEINWFDMDNAFGFGNED